MDGPIVIPPLPSIALAAEKDADKPALPATADDLSDTTSQRFSSETWHTGGTLPAGGLLRNQLLRGEVG